MTDKNEFTAETCASERETKGHKIRAVRHPDGSVSFWATIGAPDLSVVLSPTEAARLAVWLGERGEK